jgi:hypothetical protein
MRFVQASLDTRTTGSTTVHRRSRVAAAMLGFALAASIVPGVASASHGRPHPETYLENLQQHFAIEYLGAVQSEPISNTILAGFQRRLEIEYPADTPSETIPSTLLDGRQRQLAIEY